MAGGWLAIEVMLLTLHDRSQICNAAGSVHGNRGHSRLSGIQYHEGNRLLEMSQLACAVAKRCAIRKKDTRCHHLQLSDLSMCLLSGFMIDCLRSLLLQNGMTLCVIKVTARQFVVCNCRRIQPCAISPHLWFHQARPLLLEMFVSQST